MFRTYRPRSRSRSRSTSRIGSGRGTSTRARSAARFVLILLGVTFFAAAASGQIPIVIPLFGAEPDIVITGGAAVSMDDLDGVIGPEWSDSSVETIRLGQYNATVYQKRDETYLYVAMVIETNHSFPRGFEAFLIFDNGDGRDYDRGDDMLLVQENGGEAEDADYYYMDLYDYRLDRRTGGQTNAYGAGRYDETSRHYVFEFRKELESGDPRDEQLCTGCDVLVIYGWASY